MSNGRKRKTTEPDYVKLAQVTANDTGKFEETTYDEEEYKRLKWEMERSREAGQSGQALT